MHWMEKCALENNWGVTDKIRYTACERRLELWEGFVASGWFFETGQTRWKMDVEGNSPSRLSNRQATWFGIIILTLVSTLHVQLLLSVIGPREEQLKSQIVFPNSEDMSFSIKPENIRFLSLGMFVLKWCGPNSLSKGFRLRRVYPVNQNQYSSSTNENWFLYF